MAAAGQAVETSWSLGRLWRTLTVGVTWSPVYIGFLVYMFVIITYRLPLAQAALGFSALALLLDRNPFRISRVLVLLGVFLAWCLVGYSQSMWGDVVMDRLTDMLKLWVIVLIAGNALRTRAQLRFFFVFCLACYAFYPVRGSFFTFFFYHSTMAGRAVWNYVYANPNDLAAQTLLWLGVSAGVLVSERKGPVRVLALIGVIVLTLLVFLTQSRGGILALAPLAIGALVYSKGGRLRTLGMLAVAGATLALFAPASVWERLRGLENATDTEHLNRVDSSAQQRYEIWRVARAIIADHPVFGVGFGAYPNEHGRYAPQFAAIAAGNRDTHSTYLNVTAETGFIGLALFLTIFGATIWHAEGVRRRVVRVNAGAAQQILFLELGLVSFFMAGVFGSFSHLNVTYVYTMFVWTLAEATKREILTPGGGARAPNRFAARPMRWAPGPQPGA